MGSGSDRLTLCVSVHKGVSRSVLRDPRRGAGELDHQPVALGWCCAIPSRGFPLLPTVTSSLDGGLLGPNCPLGSPGEKKPSPGLEGNSDLPPSCLRGGPHVFILIPCLLRDGQCGGWLPLTSPEFLSTYLRGSS